MSFPAAEAYQPAGGDASRSAVLLIPGDLATRTGGYEYDRRIAAGLRARGWDVSVCELDGSFPFPTPAARAAARRALAALPYASLILADGLAFGAMAEEAELEATRLRFIALVHHPLALESGLSAAAARQLLHSERRALGTARHVIVTSPATADALRPFGVPADSITVVPPGTAPAPVAKGSRGVDPADPAAPVALLIVATLTPRKGYDVLLGALAELRHLHWHLSCAGSTRLHPPTTELVLEHIAAHGLAGRVALLGELDEAALAALYHRSDVFVLPTRLEGYGMAVAEAIARGLPVVSTPTGAIPDLVDASSGVLVAVDDRAALTRALARLIADDEWRAGLTAGARRRRRQLSRWDEAAERVADVLARHAVAEAGGGGPPAASPGA